MRLSLLVFALLQSFSFCHAAESKPPWQAEWDKIVAGAKKEGEVRLWGDQEITHLDIVGAFTKEYPFIKPVTVSGRVGELMPRIIAERRAGKYLADLYSGGLGGDVELVERLEPFEPDSAVEQKMPEARCNEGAAKASDCKISKSFCALASRCYEALTFARSRADRCLLRGTNPSRCRGRIVPGFGDPNCESA